MADETVEKTEIQMDEDLFTEGFEAAITEVSAGSETTSEKKEELAEAKKVEEEKKVEEQPKPDEKEERIKTLEKALEDTKSWGTKSAQELADLKREIAELKAKTPEPEPEPPEEVKKFYEDYPEMKKAVEWEAKRLFKGNQPAAEIAPQIIGQLVNNIGLMTFQDAVRNGFEPEAGKWMEGHADGIRIMRSKEFNEWLTKEKIDVSTPEFNQPSKAIEVISRFKEAKVKGALSEKDRSEAKEKEEKRDAAGAIISSTKGGGGGSKIDNADYDGAFEEAAKGST